MSGRSKYRLFLCVVLVMSLAGIYYVSKDYIDNKMPSQINVLSNDSTEIDLGIPFTGEITKVADNDSGNVLSVNFSDKVRIITGEADRYNISFKLFGIFAVKNVELDVLDSTQVIPCGMPVGLYLKTNGILIVDIGEYIGDDGINKSPCQGIISNILKISNIITEMNQASNIDELMLIEAHGHQIYYECFNDILDNPSFLFVRRSKRPPKDAINSLISFGNVYMYNRIAMEIRKSMLDIRVGFLHATNQRSESLNLDIAEIFKPVIVDRVIFSMINKNMINVDRHFDNINSGIYLNKQGKIIFLEELERKLYTVITINDGVMTYDRVIKNEIKKIKQSILYDEKYKPYKYIN